jgi:hypothetical protein
LRWQRRGSEYWNRDDGKEGERWPEAADTNGEKRFFRLAEVASMEQSWHGAAEMAWSRDEDGGLLMARMVKKELIWWSCKRGPDD